MLESALGESKSVQLAGGMEQLFGGELSVALSRGTAPLYRDSRSYCQ